MTTNTQRHTARPSRSRVSLARVSGWANAHAFGLTLASGLAFVASGTAFLAVAVRHDLGVSVRDAVLIAVASALITTVALFFGCSLASEHASKRTERVWRRIYARLQEEHAKAVEQRETARDERDLALREMRNAQRECSRMSQDLAKSGERMSASYEITKAERDALEEESANLSALIRALISPTFADATRDDLRVWIMAGNSETAYAHAFHNGEGVSLDDEITRREAYAILKEVTR